MKYNIPAILCWYPSRVLGMCLQAVNWSKVIDKRFLPLLLLFFKILFISSVLNAVIFLWKRKAKLGSEQKLGGCGFPVQLCQGFPAGLVVESSFYNSASSHIPSRVSWVRRANKPWQQPCRKAWKTSSSEELNGKLLARISSLLWRPGCLIILTAPSN